jgi:hypothetical protein
MIASDQFKNYSGSLGLYEETPKRSNIDKRISLLTNRLQEKYSRTAHAFLYFDKNHVYLSSNCWAYYMVICCLG